MVPPKSTLTAVSLGTPHLSLAGFERLTPLIAAVVPARGVTIYVSTGRGVLREVAMQRF